MANDRFAQIRGFPRSGSNWLCSILNLHPKIICKGEFHLQALHLAQKKIVTANWTIYRRKKAEGQIIADGVYNSIVSVLNAQRAFKQSATIVVDRSPGELVPDYLPGSKILFLVRDPRDVLVSWTFHYLKIGSFAEPTLNIEEMNKKLQLFSEDINYFEKNPFLLCDNQEWLRHIAVKWSRVNQSYLDLLESDSAYAGNNVKLIRYEEMLADIHIARAEIYDFLGVDPMEALPLENDKSTLPGFTHGTPDSFFRKGEAGAWRQFLSFEQERSFTEMVFETMTKFGYSANK